jgi:predicted nucleic acid-binding protein
MRVVIDTNCLIASIPNVELSESYFYYNFIEADPDDNKFANLAISTNARYLVSNDKHFNVFRYIDFPVLEVVTLDEFKVIIDK